MLHSDQEPVLVQLLKTVQSRRVKRTLVRHGPRASHQSQGKIENANRVINGVCRAMWLSLEDLLREKLPSDSILIAWLIRHAAWCLTRFQVKNDGRTGFVRVFGKAYTSQMLPFGERVMYKYTSVPTGNLDQRWCHGIWVGKAPMTDEHIFLTENVVQKARSLHRVHRSMSCAIGKGIGRRESRSCRNASWTDHRASQESAPVAQQVPASSSSGPAAPMPTQNFQNEQMDSPVELGPTERRERKGARPSETPTSEISGRPDLQ